MLTKLGLALAAVAVVATGCSSDSQESLPDGAGLLQEAATAAGGISSAHLALKVNGTPPGINVRSVNGDVNKAGDAKGTLTFDFSGALIEGEFAVVGGTAFFKGPTGGWQPLSKERAAAIYDSTALLDPQRGIPNLLAKTTEAKTDRREKVGETKTFKVTGKAAKDTVLPIVPGVRADLEMTYWIAEDSKRPVRIWFQLPDEAQKPTAEATLTDFDKPVVVSPPA